MPRMIGSVLIASFFCIVPQFSMAAPTEADLRLHLESVFPEMIIDEIEFKAFPDVTPDKGRVSLRGQYHLESDLYEIGKEAYGFLGADLAARGIDLALSVRIFEVIWGYERTHSSIGYNGYADALVSYEAGSPLEFNSELSFLETISGFSFEGKIEVNQPFGEKTVPADTIMVGSTEYEMIVGAFSRYKAAIGPKFVPKSAPGKQDLFTGNWRGVCDKYGNGCINVTFENEGLIYSDSGCTEHHAFVGKHSSLPITYFNLEVGSCGNDGWGSRGGLIGLFDIGDGGLFYLVIGSGKEEPLLTGRLDRS